MRYSESVTQATNDGRHNQQLTSSIRGAGRLSSDFTRSQYRTMDTSEQKGRGYVERAARLVRSICGNDGRLSGAKRTLSQSEKVSPFAVQMLAHDMAIIELLKSMAAQCEADARNLVFQNIGDKCKFCPQQIPGGCGLRVGNEEA